MPSRARGRLRRALGRGFVRFAVQGAKTARRGCRALPKQSTCCGVVRLWLVVSAQSLSRASASPEWKSSSLAPSSRR